MDLGSSYFVEHIVGDDEDWGDVVVRVVEGCMSIRKEHFFRSSLSWDDEEWTPFARDLAMSLFKMEWLPPGRGLWMMGTDFVYNRGSMALYNCSACETSEDVVWAAEWAMDCLMNGVGVGFSTHWRGTATVPDKQDMEEMVIADSREGWIKSLIKLLTSYIDSPKYGKSKFPLFDYSQIRPAGEPIKGFGGTSSGSGPLEKMHQRIESYLDAFCVGRLEAKAQDVEGDRSRKVGRSRNRSVKTLPTHSTCGRYFQLNWCVHRGWECASKRRDRAGRCWG